MEALFESEIDGLELLYRGKVRDVYAIDEERLFIVTTDRLSAFDVVLPDPIPGKGEVLTQISNFWFARMAHIIPNHLIDVPLSEVLPPGADIELLARRSIVTRRLKALPVDFLKIDGAFVKNLDSEPVNLVMVQAINEVGHAMGLQTIAEFVENEAALQVLREIGVDYAQGYGVGRPAALVGAS